MINRRDLLKAIGLGGILPFVGKTEVDAAPVEASPVVQAPQYIPPYAGRGSITVYGDPGTWTHGTDIVWHSDFQRTLGQFQLYNGRHIAPVLGGFDDDGGAG